MILSMLLVQYVISSLLFFFNDTATTEIYTLSLHDALPISARAWTRGRRHDRQRARGPPHAPHGRRSRAGVARRRARARDRSEEHTSELQSPCNLVCRLLLEKKTTRRQSTDARSRS